MDPFTEKELIENLKSIALSLRNMDRKMDDIALSLRELASENEECGCEDGASSANPDENTEGKL